MADVAFPLLLSIGTAAAFSVPAWYFSRRNSNCYLIDYLTVFLPSTIWIGLSVSGIGKQSLGNLAELLAITLVVPLSNSIKAFLSAKWPERSWVISFANLSFLLVFTLVLRLTMPSLPE